MHLPINYIGPKQLGMEAGHIAEEHIYEPYQNEAWLLLAWSHLSRPIHAFHHSVLKTSTHQMRYSLLAILATCTATALAEITEERITKIVTEIFSVPAEQVRQKQPQGCPQLSPNSNLRMQI